MLPPFCAILIAAAIIALLLAGNLAKRIVGPLNALDLDQPLENEAYPELSPLLTRIERQHRQIGEQLSELSDKKNEFETITGSMSEGLILLDDKGRVLSINRAATILFEVDDACVGRDMPFITEEIWSGIPHEGGMLIQQRYPEYDEALSYPQDEADFETLMSNGICGFLKSSGI